MRTSSLCRYALSNVLTLFKFINSQSRLRHEVSMRPGILRMLMVRPIACIDFRHSAKRRLKSEGETEFPLAKGSDRMDTPAGRLSYSAKKPSPPCAMTSDAEQLALLFRKHVRVEFDASCGNLRRIAVAPDASRQSAQTGARQRALHFGNEEIWSITRVGTCKRLLRESGIRRASVSRNGSSECPTSRSGWKGTGPVPSQRYSSRSPNPSPLS